MRRGRERFWTNGSQSEIDLDEWLFFLLSFFFRRKTVRRYRERFYSSISYLVCATMFSLFRVRMRLISETRLVNGAENGQIRTNEGSSIVTDKFFLHSSCIQFISIRRIDAIHRYFFVSRMRRSFPNNWVTGNETLHIWHRVALLYRAHTCKMRRTLIESEAIHGEQ